jgi:predicted nucleic acid-binding protein
MVSAVGLVSHPNAADKNKQAAQWFRGLLVADVAVLVPEIADYELHRELLRVDKARSVAVLDRYKASLGYVSLTTEAMLLAAQFWATARQKGKPPAPDLALDADVILAAQAEVLRSGGEDDVVIATTNEGHLCHFVPAQAWQNVGVT